MGSCLLMFPGVRSSLIISSSGLEPPASGFWSRLLHPYSREDKIHRFMVKELSIARNTQKDSESYIEEREEGDGGDEEEKRKCHRGREQSSQ